MAKILGIEAIEREALEFILGVARSSHPREFAGVLRARGGAISEILILPGTASETSALLRLHALPLDPSACGTVHSHPTSSPLPSPEDLRLFAKFGRIHIITAFPYDKRSWRAYDHNGNEVTLKVIG
jgi:proteasome lid subunit RPN8/RPN11